MAQFSASTQLEEGHSPILFKNLGSIGTPLMV